MITKLNSEIRREGLDVLKGRWGAAVLVSFVYTLIATVVALLPFVSSFAFLVTLPLVYGLGVWYLSFSRNRDAKAQLSTLFDGFSDYSRVFVTLLLVGIYTFLWALLLIIPGVIKSLSYSLTIYILADNHEMKNNEAIELSMRMMKGHKMRLFLLNLNFLMWVLLSLLTAGVALLWVQPYIQATMVAFYEDRKLNYEANCASDVASE